MIHTRRIAAPEYCPLCGTCHPEESPHDVYSFTYQVRFMLDHGRKPTWFDAMAHCTETMRDQWLAALKRRGIL